MTDQPHHRENDRLAAMEAELIAVRAENTRLRALLGLDQRADAPVQT